MLPVIILGTGPDAHVASDIIQSNDTVLYGFFSAAGQEIPKEEIHEVSVLGSMQDKMFSQLVNEEEKVDIVLAESDLKLRKEMYEKLKSISGRIPSNCIHPQAVVSRYAALGHGNLVSAGTIISADVLTGDFNSIQAGVVIETGAKTGSFNSIGSGTKICTGAIIEDEVQIGAGAVICAGVVVQSGAVIQPGSIVIKSVNRNKKVGGNPADVIK